MYEIHVWDSFCTYCSVSLLQFATVYKARDKTTDTIVAIKKVQEISLHFTSLALASLLYADV